MGKYRNKRVHIGEPRDLESWRQLASVQDAKGCWIWQRKLCNGLPTQKFKGRDLSAIRVAYTLKTGIELSRVDFTTTTCGVKLCINPDHIKIKNRAKLTNEERKKRILDSVLIPANGVFAGCWEWTGRIKEDGYAELSIEGRRTQAHRHSYEIFTGYKFKPGEKALHSCDNRKCVNPAHLRPGTTWDNSQDMLKRERAPLGKATLSPEDVFEIKKHIKMGTSQKETAKLFKVNTNTVRDIRVERTWFYIPWPKGSTVEELLNQSLPTFTKISRKQWLTN